MSYVDAYYDKKHDLVRVVERINGKRVYNDYPAVRTFYTKDQNGQHRSIFGDKLRQIRCKTTKDFHKELKILSGKKLFESDIKPENQCLSENYNGVDSPVLHTAFYDIEVDFDKERGFSSTEEAFMPITAITVYLDWLELLITLVIPPKGMSDDEAEEICSKFENTSWYRSEKEMIDTFLSLIEDADVISGWNSEGYDIPYTVRRIIQVLGKEYIKKLCLWGVQPKEKYVMKYGREQLTYELIGRVHLDYLELYRKYTYHEMHSYSLDAISEYELGRKKIAYEGNLDQLYNEDFYKFVAYNREDVMLIADMDKKLRFIDLANEIAHDNTVMIKTTMGAVAVTEQAIINEAHRRNMHVPDRKARDWNEEDSDDPMDMDEEELAEFLAKEKAAGAFVAQPKTGLQKWVAGIDLNSLYPSVLRALNMSPETIVAQIRQDYTEAMITSRIMDGKKKHGKSFGAPQAWEDTFSSEEFRYVNERDKIVSLTLDMEDGSSSVLTGAEIYDLIFNTASLNWGISANGTVFTQDVQGIIPSLLERWYSERKQLQAKMKEARDQGDDKQVMFWDKRQLVKKINLNSLYGAILNPGCRFYDKRIGQSTTLSGRCITRHMGSKTNEVIAGEYDYKGESIIYGDTDSIYFSMYPVYKDKIDSGEIAWSKEIVIDLYDEIANQVNASFPDFMISFFHVPRKQGEIIRAGRENAATMGIFIKKKRYAMLIYDDDGKRKDVDGLPGKVKAMGLDLKRSDTPVFMQDFLKDVLMKLLTEGSSEEVIGMIKAFKKEFRKMPSWLKGTPKRVNNLTNHTKIFEKTGKCGVGHAMAAINWNRLRKMNSDGYSMEISDGMKTIVCKLKPNPMDITSIAYPIDELKIPLWFQELPFDNDLMEHTIITKKINNLVGVLDWDLNDTNNSETFDNLFEF